MGRFMRGYGYTRAQTLGEPALSFFALLGALSKLHAEEDMRTLMVAGAGANPGEKGDAFNKVMDSLRKQAGQDAQGRTVPDDKRFIPGRSPIVSVAEPGVLARERLERAARAAEVEREWKRKLGRKTD